MLQDFTRNSTITVARLVGRIADENTGVFTFTRCPRFVTMNPEEEIEQPSEQTDEHTEYEAPRIESALTPEDLAREVQYAGVTDTVTPVG
ncbi:MAG: hypothetical protein M3O61_14210 [Gemmatimonadota bacterium]|nr:hypothetical protein [Gemmatimonadota bacterium]